MTKIATLAEALSALTPEVFGCTTPIERWGRQACAYPPHTPEHQHMLARACHALEPVHSYIHEEQSWWHLHYGMLCYATHQHEAAYRQFEASLFQFPWNKTAYGYLLRVAAEHPQHTLRPELLTRIRHMGVSSDITHVYLRPHTSFASYQGWLDSQDWLDGHCPLGAQDPLSCTMPQYATAQHYWQCYEAYQHSTDSAIQLLHLQHGLQHLRTIHDAYHHASGVLYRALGDAYHAHNLPLHAYRSYRKAYDLSGDHEPPLAHLR